MILFPDAQKRALEEIDRVIGGDRLPDISGRVHLPYCVALCKEILRFARIRPGPPLI